MDNIRKRGGPFLLPLLLLLLFHSHPRHDRPTCDSNSFVFTSENESELKFLRRGHPQ